MNSKTCGNLDCRHELCGAIRHYERRLLEVEASLAAERSRVNEAERERDQLAKSCLELERREANAHARADAVNLSRIDAENRMSRFIEATAPDREELGRLRRALETRDAEVARLLAWDTRWPLVDVLAKLASFTRETFNMGYDPTGWETAAAAADAADRIRVAAAALATPEATTPAVPHERPHLIGGEFQSDKYPTCPRGKVPLSTKDATAQDLLWEYAQRRRAIDAEFAADLETALRNHGFAAPAVPGRLAEAEALLAAPDREQQCVLLDLDPTSRGCSYPPSQGSCWEHRRRAFLTPLSSQAPVTVEHAGAAELAEARKQTDAYLAARPTREAPAANAQGVQEGTVHAIGCDGHPCWCGAATQEAKPRGTAECLSCGHGPERHAPECDCGCDCEGSVCAMCKKTTGNQR